MRRPDLIILGMLYAPMASAAGIGITGNDLKLNCPSILSQNRYEAIGRKLAVRKMPDLDSPQNALRFCSGSATYHFISYPDGSVHSQGADADVFVDVQCSVGIENRFGAMRLVPPRAYGKPVCVAFDVAVRSNEPGKWHVWGPQR